MFPIRSEFYIFILKVENVAVCQTGLEISENKVQIVHVCSGLNNITIEYNLKKVNIETLVTVIGTGWWWFVCLFIVRVCFIRIVSEPNR